MKNSLTILLSMTLLATITGFKIVPDDSKQNNDKERIEVIFNRHLEFNDLVKIKLDMSQHGIVLNYKKLEFDDYGKLIFISFQVDCKDGFSGSAWTGGEELTNQSHFGFYRDYSLDTDSPFGTGEMK